MADDRFYKSQGPILLSEVAAKLNGEIRPPDAHAISLTDIAPLLSAAPTHISVFTDGRYLSALEGTRAGVVITSADLSARLPSDVVALIVADPRLAFAEAGHLFYPPAAPKAGVAATARIAASASVGANTQVDHGASLEEGVEVGTGCVIGPNTVLSEGVKVGDHVRIGPNCSISHAIIGNRTEIASNVTIGSEGFGFVASPAGLLRMQQLGIVTIGEGVKVGANCTIDRGTTENTVIGDGTVFDNQVHIAHNVSIGRHCVICGQVGIAGSSLIGDRVMIGGQAGISDHITVGSDAKIAAKSGVIRNVAPGLSVGGYPAIPLKAWHKQTAGLIRLFDKAAALRRNLPAFLPILLSFT